MWTREQILAMAPDDSARKAGISLAKPSTWSDTGMQKNAVWGRCQGSGKDPYKTCIDLEEPAFRCSCPSRKFPCKHGLGLFLLFAEGAWSEGSPPEWVTEWVEGRRKKAEKKSAAESTSDIDPQTAAKRAAAEEKRAEKRHARVGEGLDEAERFLHDVIRQGLAVLPQQMDNVWEQQAARLVDAQAPGLADWMRDTASLLHTGDAWQEKTLEHLGLIQLLITAYKKLDRLPTELQHDVRTLIGWTTSQDDVLSQTPLSDTWQVVGRTVDDTNRVKEQRTWLWSQVHRRMALLLDFAAGRKGFDTTLQVGTQFDADLVFFPSILPLRALVHTRRGTATPMQQPPTGGISSWQAAGETWVHACSQLPWIRRIPLLLQQVIPVPHKDELRLYDPQGMYVSFRGNEMDFWRLVALSSGKPLFMMGEWEPFSFRVSGFYDPMQALWLGCSGKEASHG